jgi:hypothetical protein
MKRLALIEYDCGEIACEECEHLDTVCEQCDLFGHNVGGWPYRGLPYRRLKQCIVATQRAAAMVEDVKCNS